MTRPGQVMRAAAQRRAVLRTGIAAAVLAGAGLLAGCGSSGSSGGPAATVTVTAPPSSAAPSASSSTPGAPVGSGGSGSAPAGPASCATSALHLELGQGNGTAGSVIVPIEFTNASTSACSLFGFPGVSFVTGVGGSQIGASAGENNATARKLVTLAPGGKAHALLQIVVAQNFPAAKCKLVTAHWLKVFPPGQTAALYLKHTSPTCSAASTSVRVLNVQAVQAGDGDS